MLIVFFQTTKKFYNLKINITFPAQPPFPYFPVGWFLLWKGNLARTPESTRRELRRKVTLKRLKSQKVRKITNTNPCSTVPRAHRNTENYESDLRKKHRTRWRTRNNKNLQTKPIHPGRGNTQTTNIDTQNKRARTKREKWGSIRRAIRPPPASRHPAFSLLRSEPEVLPGNHPFLCLSFHSAEFFPLIHFFAFIKKNLFLYITFDFINTNSSSKLSIILFSIRLR